MTASRKPTKSQRLAIHRMSRALYELDSASIDVAAVRAHVPDAWATLMRDIDVEEPKVKVTLLLSESVAKFFRGMGRGYQRRINRVLETYAQLQIGNLEAMLRELAPEEREIFDDRRYW